MFFSNVNHFLSFFPRLNPVIFQGKSHERITNRRPRHDRERERQTEWQGDRQTKIESEQGRDRDRSNESENPEAEIKKNGIECKSGCLYWSHTLIGQLVSIRSISSSVGDIKCSYLANEFQKFDIYLDLIVDANRLDPGTLPVVIRVWFWPVYLRRGHSYGGRHRRIEKLRVSRSPHLTKHETIKWVVCVIVTKPQITTSFLSF